jgi:hypothetical protein
MKPWYKQKTLWAGAALILTGIGELVCGEDKGTAISHLFEGAGLIFMRAAINQTRSA